MLELGMLKFAMMVAKLPGLLKFSLISAAIVSTAIATDLPIHDIWFDYVLFIVASAIVGGMPEPDTDLPPRTFAYTWMYRSGHLLVANATAYFMHQKNWGEISGSRQIRATDQGD